ncbi:hypothetical protein TNCV_1176681 [Trichonephila clavipes]|nr:hypothetical protein TNCV_1176681 [Trichonephila clavipes]
MEHLVAKSGTIQSESRGKSNSSDMITDSSYYIPTSHRVHDKKSPYKNHFFNRPLSGRSYGGQSGCSKNRDQKLREKISGGGDLIDWVKGSDIIQPRVHLTGYKNFEPWSMTGSQSEQTVFGYRPRRVLVGVCLDFVALPSPVLGRVLMLAHVPLCHSILGS